MIEWWMVLGALGYTAAIADAGYEWGRRRGRKEGERRVLEHPRPDDALWVRSTAPKPEPRRLNMTARAAANPNSTSRVSRAKMTSRKKKF